MKNKASYGHDEISNKLIKRAGPALIKSLTLMVNQMLFTGIFLDSLKISKVKPLFKAGDPILISNYRPISLNGGSSPWTGGVYEYSSACKNESV